MIIYERLSERRWGIEIEIEITLVYFHGVFWCSAAIFLKLICSFL